MKIKEVIILENKNTNSIILHKEGLFWRAYEKSAFLFMLHIKEYKVIKKYYKNVKSEVTHLGFPHSSLPGILQIAEHKIAHETENKIVIAKYELYENEYTKWKQSIQLCQSFKTLAKLPETSNLSDKIRNFPVASKTPIECQQFINELQNELNGNICTSASI